MISAEWVMTERCNISHYDLNTCLAITVCVSVWCCWYCFNRLPDCHVCEIVRLVIKTSPGSSGEFLLPPRLVTTDGCHSPLSSPPLYWSCHSSEFWHFISGPAQRSHLAVIAKLLMGRNEKQKLRDKHIYHHHYLPTYLPFYHPMITTTTYM